MYGAGGLPQPGHCRKPWPHTVADAGDAQIGKLRMAGKAALCQRSPQRVHRDW